MIWQQISLANRLTHQSPTRTDYGRQWRTRAKHSRLKSGPPLMRGLDVYQNIDVSDTKLTLGLWVCFISSNLTVNKLFPINPRAITGPPKMSLLLDVESTSALIIEPRLILVLPGQRKNLEWLLKYMMWCCIWCDALYNVKQHMMWCSIRCDAAFDVMQHFMWCSIWCDAAYDVIQHMMWCRIPSQSKGKYPRALYFSVLERSTSETLEVVTQS